MEKEVKIIPPEGYEIDRENSTLDKIVFKEKKEVLTYEDICVKLFKDRTGYYIDKDGTIVSIGAFRINDIFDLNNSRFKEQLECILAKNKLANVARYLNGDWNPNLENHCWTIVLHSGDELNYQPMSMICPASSSNIIFKSPELAKQAIEILGEDEIKLALKPLY